MRVEALQGDTVDLICQRHLGRTGGITEAVLDANPGLAALGPVLPMGTPIILPDTAPVAAPSDLLQLWD